MFLISDDFLEGFFFSCDLTSSAFVVLTVGCQVYIQPLVSKSFVYVSDMRLVWQSLETAYLLQLHEVFYELIGMDVAVRFVCSHEPYIVCYYIVPFCDEDLGPQMLNQGVFKQFSTKNCVIFLENSRQKFSFFLVLKANNSSRLIWKDEEKHLERLFMRKQVLRYLQLVFHELLAAQNKVVLCPMLICRAWSTLSLKRFSEIGPESSE